MKIQVTQKHIDEGRIVDSERCPVALAVKDVIWDGVFCHVSVTTEQITLSYKAPYVKEVYPLPKEAMKFISMFDNIPTKGVEPFEFDLPIKIYEKLNEADVELHNELEISRNTHWGDS